MDIVRGVMAAMCGALSWFAPVSSLIILVLVFVGIDFMTGVWASYKRAKKRAENKCAAEKRTFKKQDIEWQFSSERMRSTVTKTVFYVMGIVLVWLLETHVLTFVTLYLTKLFAGFVLGVELFSFLENAADISNHPVFRWLKKFTAQELKDKTGIDIEGAKQKDK